MGFYSLYVTEKPCPKSGPPYPQAYVDSWRHIITDKTTKAHILQIADLLKSNAKAYWGVRVFEERKALGVRVFAGKDLGKLIYEWTLSDGKGKP